MIKDYVPSKREPLYVVVFYTSRGCGYSFDCDENGKVDLEKLEPLAAQNYKDAMQHPEKFPYAWNEVTERGSNRIPATGICNCGKKIELYAQYMGACECPHCGQWWNVFGQELKDVSRWNDYGEMDVEY
jgi:hypothetical protein